MQQKEPGDMIVFKVKPGSDAKATGSALAHSIYENKQVTMRAVGAGAINQAQKAVAIANVWTASKGILLATIPGWFEDEDLDGRSFTGMSFRVIEVH